MTLRVYGRVARPLVLTDEDLALMPAPGEAVEGVVGSAVAVRDVLGPAEPDPEATHCTVIAAGGSYRASIPLADLQTGGWLSYAVDGGPLPPEAGRSLPAHRRRRRHPVLERQAGGRAEVDGRQPSPTTSPPNRPTERRRSAATPVSTSTRCRHSASAASSSATTSGSPARRAHSRASPSGWAHPERQAARTVGSAPASRSTPTISAG